MVLFTKLELGGTLHQAGAWWYIRLVRLNVYANLSTNSRKCSTCTIIALSDTELGKVILPSTVVFTDVITGKIVDPFDKEDKPSLDREIKAMQYANTINDLIPKFIRKDTWQNDEGNNYDMIVMERL
ncbi:MAG: hypothetical protein RLZZ292_825 [Bacteroidota bacterium]